MSNTHTTALSAAGVSIWLDDLSRQRIESGDLARLITERNVVGVTTNPTIFAGAIGGGIGYGERIADCARRGLSAVETVVELTSADVADACDILAEVYEASEGRDGRVSLEVAPELAHDAAGTVEQARELWARVNRPNAMIKIPATEAGVEAIADVIAEGISVNVTLVFSLARYREVINAYLVGIERARAAGMDISRIHSVASVFISRFDSEIDPRLDAAAAAGDEAAAGLRCRAGIANARLAYEIYRESFASERARLLLEAGAHAQRPLWASTGTKDPSLPDTHYLSELALPGTVNTVPAATLEAFADHGTLPEWATPDAAGEAARSALTREAETTLNSIDASGVDYVEVAAKLEAEAVKKFIDSWQEMVHTVVVALEAAK